MSGHREAAHRKAELFTQMARSGVGYIIALAFLLGAAWFLWKYFRWKKGLLTQATILDYAQENAGNGRKRYRIHYAYADANGNEHTGECFKPETWQPADAFPILYDSNRPDKSSQDINGKTTLTVSAILAACGLPLLIVCAIVR